ncbi:MAG: TRAP transporter substrate-binding protein, partial [Myxococcota bacterium]
MKSAPCSRPHVALLFALGPLACTQAPAPASTGGAPAAAPKAETFAWKMVTTWPKNFPGLGTAPERFAVAVNEMSGGRLTVKVYGGGELVPPLEVFDAVAGGTAEMGHGAAYYWKGKVPEAQFFAAVPFGLTAQEMNGWLRYGGGLELWRETYAPHGLIPIPCGNTGVQMGGWFNNVVASLEDILGLKMSIPGLGGEVFEKAGGVPVLLPGSELFTSLQTGAIDATEWVGPYNDLAFGLHKAAKIVHYPGWHEPGTTLELIVSKAAFDKLPKDLQAIVRYAADYANQSMLDEYTFRNGEAMAALQSEHGVKFVPFPKAVLEQFRELSS